MDYGHIAEMDEYATIQRNVDIPEDSDVDTDAVMILSDDATGIVYSAATSAPPPPPARILARFYKPSQTARRKTSAASSRRNSMTSSTHSHHSNRSFHHRAAGKASDHVAQHLLRRASIIENRRARLADRAAHAQQVRLRAALAKAVPQTRALSSEERALAAHQARERHLAQVAAACAEEVRRSKKVAEDMKERKAAEEKRYRLEMEERLAEADRRRAEYKKAGGVRRPRTGSAVAADGKKVAAAAISEELGEESTAPLDIGTVVLDEEEAAGRIQRVWRARRYGRTVKEFDGLGLSLEKVRASDFEPFSAFVAEERVISVTKRLLQVFNLQDNGLGESENSTNVRAFLSAYLILGHPIAVFRQDGDQERLLIARAEEVLTKFESLLTRATAQGRRELTGAPCISQHEEEELRQSFKNYMTAFTAWKAHDFSALVDTMVASFVELDAIWQTVKDKGGDAAAEEYREGVRSNQALILSKIKRLAGPEKANDIVLKAVRESRRTRKKGKREGGGDVRPRAVEAEGPVAESKVLANDTGLQSKLTEPSGLPGNGTADENTMTISPISLSSSSKATDDHAQAFHLTRLFSPIPSNRILAHELALDKTYRVTLSPYLADPSSSVYTEVCTAMRQGFESGQGALWTVAMAENIRGKLLRLLTPGNSMYNLISETLDLEHIYRQCSKDVFSYEKFFSFMADILPKLCAPVRDEEARVLVRRLRDGSSDGASTVGSGSLGDLIDKLLQLLHFIDLLSLDFMNYMLQRATPVLLKESTGYEQRLFAQDLEQGVITLERTRAWWKRAVESASANANGDGTFNSQAQGHDDSIDSATGTTHQSAQTRQQVYTRALLGTAVELKIPIPEADLPETLALDRDRLTCMRTDILRIVTAGAILLTAKNLLKRDVRVPWRTEASRMLDVLKDSSHKSIAGVSGGDIASTRQASTTSTALSTATATSTPPLPSRILSILESTHALPPTTRTQLHGTIAKLLAQANAERLTDPVAKVLLQRIKTQISSRLLRGTSGASDYTFIAAGLRNSSGNVNASGSGGIASMHGINGTATNDKIVGAAAAAAAAAAPATSTASVTASDATLLTASGLPEFVTHVAELGDALRRIADVDWAAHACWYERVAGEV